MTSFEEGLADIVQRDPRYACEAYEFLFHALHHTQRMLGRSSEIPPEKLEDEKSNPVAHVSGPELLQGVCDLALHEYGLMARTVLRMWGINKTDDFGEMVFNLVAGGLMCKTDSDTREDFHDVFDLDEVLIKGYRIDLDEVKEQ